MVTLKGLKGVIMTFQGFDSLTAIVRDNTALQKQTLANFPNLNLVMGDAWWRLKKSGIPLSDLDDSDFSNNVGTLKIYVNVKKNDDVTNPSYIYLIRVGLVQLGRIPRGSRPEADEPLALVETWQKEAFGTIKPDKASAIRKDIDDAIDAFCIDYNNANFEKITSER